MQRGRGAVVGGAAGVGKTRLAREVATRLGEQPVAWASATPATSELALGGLAGLDLAFDGALPDRAGVLSLLTARLLERSPRVAVAVDDAHLLDDLSAAFVHHLVVSGAAPVLLTIRTGEQVPAPIVSLYKDEHVPRLELQPLTRREFDELADELAGNELDAASHARLWELAAGNALFLRELILDAQESASLVRAADGRTRWRPRGGVGPRLAELVVDRMGRLDEPRRELAELLALAEPLSLAIVEALLADVDLAAAERSGLIVVDVTSHRTELRLAHPLFGEVVRSRMPVLHRRALHARLAEALAATGARRPGDTLRIALWRVESATSTDPQFLLDAARQARAQFDVPLAIRLARASHELTPSFDAALVLGGALAERGDLDGAQAALDGLVGDEPDDRGRQILMHDRAWIAFQRPEGIARARAILEAGEEAMTDPRLRLLARRDLALLLTYAGRFGEAASIIEPLVAPGVDDDVRWRSLPAFGACLVMAGRHRDVLTLCDDIEVSLGGGPSALPVTGLFILATRVNALLLGGWTEEAAAMITSLVDREQPMLLRAADLGYIRTKLARIHLLQGRPRCAAAELHDAVDILRGADSHRCLTWALSLAAEAHALLGDLDSARRHAAEAEVGRAAGAPAFDGDAARARTWVELCSGARSNALAGLVHAADEQVDRGQPAFALFALHDAMRLGADYLAPRLRELAERCDGPWPAAAAMHAAAIVSGDADSLEATAQTFASVPMALVAAELWMQARAGWEASGHTARATAAARHAREQLGRTEVVSTPLLAESTTLVRLTRREREVATLAAEGLANAEIAQRLFVSVRTVESHLYSAYAKLGVADRSELAAVIEAQ